jgi:hypothetical protein
MEETLESYFQDVISCTLEDFDPDANEEEREKIVQETSKELSEYAKYYAWEKINDNYLEYKTTKRNGKRKRAHTKLKREWQESVALDLVRESDKEIDLREVKRRKLTNVLEKAGLPTPAYFDPEKKIPEDILELPTTDKNEVEGWDYMGTYNITTGSILALIDANLEEVFSFLIRNCHSVEEMKDEVEKMIEYELTDEEIVGPVKDLLNDIVKMKDEKLEEVSKKLLEDENYRNDIIEKSLARMEEKIKD